MSSTQYSPDWMNHASHFKWTPVICLFIYAFLIIHIFYPPYNFNEYGQNLDAILNSSQIVMMGFIWLPLFLSIGIVSSISLNRWLATSFLLFLSYYTISLTVSNLDTYRFNPSIQLPYALLIFALGAFLFQKTKKKSVIYVLILLVGLFEATMGVAQHVIWRWTEPGNREAYQWILPLVKFHMHDGSSFHRDILRASGTLLEPNNLGLFLTITGMLSLFIYTKPFRSNLKLYLVILAHILMAIGIYYSYSRASWLGTIVGLGILSYPFFKHANLKFKVVLPLLVALFLLFEFQTLNQRAESMDTGTKSVSTRLTLWKSSWEMFQHHPWFGVGAGNFSNAIVPYQPGEITKTVPSCMNSHLLILVELGLIGFLLYGLLFGCLMYQIINSKGFQRWFGFAFLFAVGVNGIFTHILNINPSAMLWWLGVGIVSSMFASNQKIVNEKSSIESGTGG